MDKSIIFKDIFAELKRAEAKFPGWPQDPIHALAVVQEEVGETQKAVLQAMYEPEKSGVDHVYEEAIQMAAMAIRFLLGFDNYKYEVNRDPLQLLESHFDNDMFDENLPFDGETETINVVYNTIKNRILNND